MSRRAKKIRSAALYIFIAALSCALIGTVIMLLREWRLRFPAIAAGSYLGSLTLSSGGEFAQIYMERGSNRSDLLLVVLRKGWLPQVVIPSPTENDSWLPISIKSDEGALTFMGDSVSEGSYKGIWRTDSATGEWTATKVTSPINRTEEEEKDQQSLVGVIAELEELQRKIESAAKRVPEQKKEIEKLTDFVTQGEKLRARADDKFRLVKGDLAKTQTAVAGKQEEARKLEENLRIVQKVSGMGKLVSLARDSLEREGRWIETMVRPYNSSLPDDFEEALARAHRIVDIKEEIAAERRRIEHLLSPQHVDEGDDNAR